MRLILRNGADYCTELAPQLRLELIRFECLQLADTDPSNHFLATINTDSDLWNELSRHREERFNSEFRIPE
jgi:hypothetical protein